MGDIVYGKGPTGKKVPLKLAADGALAGQGFEYETVAAGQTAQVLGGSGAAGDYLDGVLIIPASTSPGAVSIIDGSTSITIFAGGSSSVADLKSFFVHVGALAVTGPWKITTGANVSAIATGSFT